MKIKIYNSVYVCDTVNITSYLWYRTKNYILFDQFEYFRRKDVVLIELYAFDLHILYYESCYY